MNTLQEPDEWEEVEMIVDSGASGTVVGTNMVRAVEAKNVKDNVTFKLADGSRTPHMGKRPSPLTRTKDTFATWWPRLPTWMTPC